MAKLTDEEQTLLDNLTKKASDPDDNDESFTVEWWEEDDKGTRRGGSLPWSQGKKVYGKHFPDLFGEKSAKDDKSGDKSGGGGDGGNRTSTKYFGKSGDKGDKE